MIRRLFDPILQMVLVVEVNYNPRVAVQYCDSRVKLVLRLFAIPKGQVCR